MGPDMDMFGWAFLVLFIAASCVGGGFLWGWSIAHPEGFAAGYKIGRDEQYRLDAEIRKEFVESLHARLEEINENSATVAATLDDEARKWLDGSRAV